MEGRVVALTAQRDAPRLDGGRPAPHPRAKRRRIKRHGLLGLGSLPPPGVPGIRQCALVLDPALSDEELAEIVQKALVRCDRCGSPFQAYERQDRAIHCLGSRGGCGRTRYVVTPPIEARLAAMRAQASVAL